MVPEKSSGLLGDRELEPVEAYEFMDAQKADHQIARMTRLLGVSRSKFL